MSRLYVLAVTAIFCIAIEADAQVSNSSRLKFDDTLDSLADSSTHYSLGLQQTVFVSSGQPYFRSNAKSDDKSLLFNVDAKRRWRGFNGRIEARDQYSGTEQWNYLEPLQLYGSMNLVTSGLLEVTLGRRLYSFTEWESTFRQSVFQPRYLENRLYPEAAGLTGAFVESRAGKNDLLFGATVFIPDFGAHLYVRDNQFYSTNPWFKPPSNHFHYRNQESDIHYSAVTPQAADVVPNAGLIARYEFKEGAYLGRLSYAYMPVPQFALGFPSQNRLQITDTGDFMNVQINARWLYHRVYSMDNVLSAGGWRLSASLTREIPDDNPGPEWWTNQQFTPAWIFAASASRALEMDGPRAARLNLAVMKVDGGDGPDRGYFAGQKSIFERRFQYREAYVVELQKPWRGPWGAESGVRLLYDRMQNGGVASAWSAMRFSGGWRATAQLDMLGLLGESSQVSDAFLTTYRANDSFTVGLGYVF